MSPVEITLPMPEEIVHRYLAIRNTNTNDVVAIIEVLSPSNKRSGSYDRFQYLTKRDEVLKGEYALREAVRFLLDTLVERSSSSVFRMHDDFVTAES
jgi:hypothetical protein